ncbi:VOC family protein, partial [bacterium]|nr:VOC family protein [bacterium]
YLKDILQNFGTLKNESIVNGRNICIFQMRVSIEFLGLKTDCIELPAPKQNSPYQEGWEHAEFVTNKPLVDFMNFYSHLTFETHALYKKINPEISIQISDNKRIKFHEQSILDVVALESAKAP